MIKIEFIDQNDNEDEKVKSKNMFVQLLVDEIHKILVEQNDLGIPKVITSPFIFYICD